MKRALSIFIMLATSCGSLRPADEPVERVVVASSSTELAAIEGRPSGVVLELRARDPRVTAVELYRVVTGGEPTLLQALPGDERMRGMLADGLEIVDSTVKAGQEVTYQLFAVGEQDRVLARSALTTVNWRPPPPRPTQLATAAPFGDVVEVSWADAGPYGAIIFRRDVLAGTEFERVALVRGPASDWVDRNVMPAGVYSYRVALAIETEGSFVQFGAPSEEVYATTPETR